ncbi:myelin-associated oligodendrocyte basic protein-like [Homalodisca vitripennis]|uniref:myelin-associated oligodendrocyte basic protein-like n=1 Tax=Homalodisca vitripennis TaxID=197043 RepID=UPI001EECD81A|nr:myelin-associated oligodendrocyte basic protein-like [Homalodisca vitripennis]
MGVQPTRRPGAAAVQLGRKSRPTKPAARRSTAQPPKRPARDESPADSVSENEAEDHMPQKKKRRRKPQNPANRLPRPPASVADLPVTQRPRATPRQNYRVATYTSHSAATNGGASS